MLEKIIYLIDSLKKKGKYRILTAVFWSGIFLFIYFIFSVNALKVAHTYLFMFGVIILTYISYYIIVYSFNKNLITGGISIAFILIGYQYFTYYLFEYLSQFEAASFFVAAKENIGDLRFYQIPFNTKVFYFTYTMSLFHLAPPLGIKLVYELLKNFYYTQKLKEENLQLEISYLHAQINPHFLLNTLTAIYNMVMDNPKAAKSIETLAGLLQYSLYDVGKEKVALDEEIKFIKNYIQISKIRLNPNKKLKFTIVGMPGELTIAPLILVNLVENCIKHGLHRISGAAQAEISITIENNTLLMTTQNQTPATTNSTQGIGLPNTRRRLEIYYPEQHTLMVENENGIYRVSLYIIL